MKWFFFSLKLAVCPKEPISLYDSGKISSTNFPVDNYTASRNCSWIITVSAGESVKLAFTYFVLSSCANCNSGHCSYVELYDGNSTSSTLLGRFCQNSLLPNTTSSGNQMFVMFHAGTDVNRGFEASYSVASTQTTPGSTTGSTPGSTPGPTPRLTPGPIPTIGKLNWHIHYKSSYFSMGLLRMSYSSILLRARQTLCFMLWVQDLTRSLSCFLRQDILLPQ